MELIQLIGKEVEVNTADMTYRGILVEVDEAEIQLQTPLGWVAVPHEKIAEIKLAE